MKTMLYKGLCLALILVLTIPAGAFAFSDIDLNQALEQTADYIYTTVQTPQVGSIGGEWAVLGLARSGLSIPDVYYQTYYAAVEDYVTACGGVLHPKKYTEYSRVIVALSSIGKDARNVAGYNLLTPLGDYEKTIWQGLNGPIWALIALDSGGYELPSNSEADTVAIRDRYIGRILECQLPDGGFSLLGGPADNENSDPDVTAMALQALAKYRERPEVKQAIEAALTCLSAQQGEDGGFGSWGTNNSESCAQAIVALCELGIPVTDPRFVKNGTTLLDNLMTYRQPDGSFRHTKGGGDNDQMATEQALYAMVALKRQMDGKNSLYRMDDAIRISAAGADQIGVSGKHPDVTKLPIIHPGKTFGDIGAHDSRSAIEALAQRGVISGQSEQSFAPDATMTRAEFAAIVTRGLGLPAKDAQVFWDVEPGDWFYSYVNTAYAYGLIQGVAEGQFQPDGTITREQAAVMVARAAQLCGLDTEVQPSAARDSLAGFADYVKASDWAISSLAFCCRQGILPDEALELRPQAPITRGEVAQMLFHMLTDAQLL